MYILTSEYTKGGRIAIEMSNDGRDYLGELAGPRQEGERSCALLEAACEDTEKGYDRLLESLAWLTEEIKKRKANATSLSA
jgi:hypothetical protein